jgi:hypothetical protein
MTTLDVNEETLKFVILRSVLRFVFDNVYDVNAFGSSFLADMTQVYK